MRTQKGKIELQKKVHRRICVRDMTFSDCALSFQCLFVAFLGYLQNDPYKDIYFAMGILCDDIMSKRSKIRKSSTI